MAGSRGDTERQSSCVYVGANRAGGWARSL